MRSSDAEVMSGVRWMYGLILLCAVTIDDGCSGGDVVGSAIVWVLGLGVSLPWFAIESWMFGLNIYLYFV